MSNIQNSPLYGKVVI